jgi:hypothetical protein
VSDTPSSFWVDAAMAQPLSAAEKQLRERFVEEYLFDFSPSYAAVRCGLPLSFASDYANKWMEEPYVRQLIAERQKMLSDNPKLEAAENQRRILARLLKEAHYNGPGASHAARVSALSQLKQIYGMDAPQKFEINQANRGGVMQVPAIADIDAWEAAATASQEQLRKDSEV